jgi:hypothetical protein
MTDIFDNLNNSGEINDLDNQYINIFTLVNLLTLIIGLVVGMIFGYYMFKKYDYKGPDSNVIINETYTETDGKKYKWVPKVCICPISYSMEKLKDPNYVDSGH